MSIIHVLRSVNKSLNNHTPKCEYLHQWLYHISTYSKVALTSTNLLVKLTHRFRFWGRRAFGRMFGSFWVFYYVLKCSWVFSKNSRIVWMILHSIRMLLYFAYDQTPPWIYIEWSLWAYSIIHLIMKIELSHEEEILITNKQYISCQRHTHITIQHPPIHYCKLKSSTRTQIKATN